MATRMIGRFLAMLFVAAAAGTASPGHAQRIGSSPAGPAPAGMTVQTIVECGEGYVSHELYDVKITLLETVRGAQAWELIKGAAAANEAPQAGFEYLLARVKFEYAARGRPGDCAHELKEEEFIALSQDGRAYEPASAVPPNPRLNGTLHPGDTLEGWVAFSVPKTDASVLMSFGTRDGGAVVHGGNTWFRLY